MPGKALYRRAKQGKWSFSIKLNAHLSYCSPRVPASLVFKYRNYFCVIIFPHHNAVGMAASFFLFVITVMIVITINPFSSGARMQLATFSQFSTPALALCIYFNTAVCAARIIRSPLHPLRKLRTRNAIARPRLSTTKSLDNVDSPVEFQLNTHGT